MTLCIIFFYVPKKPEPIKNIAIRRYADIMSTVKSAKYAVDAWGPRTSEVPNPKNCGVRGSSPGGGYLFYFFSKFQLYFYFLLFCRHYVPQTIQSDTVSHFDPIISWREAMTHLFKRGHQIMTTFIIRQTHVTFYHTL